MVRAMRIFVAGATGATGQVFVPLATAAGHDLVLHVRPQTVSRTPLAADVRARVFNLDDEAALRDALAGCDAVVSLVGTMRSRSQQGDTYESSDIGSTRQLVAGAQAESVPRFLLLGAYGTGGPGAYLKMKAECERIVRESALRWTFFRPSSLVSPPDATEGPHGQRKAPPGMGVTLSALRHLPGLRGWADDVRPIPLDVLCRAMLRVLDEPMDSATLSGRQLWQLGGATAS